MRVRRGIMAAGVTMAALGVPFATAGAAAAQPTGNPPPPPPPPTVVGVITGPHTFTLISGPVALGEDLRPVVPNYTSYVPVTDVVTWHGTITVTTGSTFLPLNRAGELTTFTVVQPPTPPQPQPQPWWWP